MKIFWKSNVRLEGMPRRRHIRGQNFMLYSLYSFLFELANDTKRMAQIFPMVKTDSKEFIIGERGEYPGFKGCT